MQDDLEKRLAKIKLDENENEEKIKDKCSELEEEFETRKTELNGIFAKVDDKRRVSCPLSFHFHVNHFEFTFS